MLFFVKLHSFTNFSSDNYEILVFLTSIFQHTCVFQSKNFTYIRYSNNKTTLQHTIIKQMKAMMIIIPLVYLSGNGYLYWKIWQTMTGIPLWGKILISLLFWLIAFSLFASIGLRNFNMPDCLLRNMFQIGSIWMVFLLYMVLLLIVLDIAKIFLW